MTTQTIICPYHQVSPLYIPRRDLVLGAADCLLLRVTVVHTDDPASMTLTLTGGLGGPVCRLFIFSECGRPWDYGAPRTPMAVLWAGTGVIADNAAGSFDFDVNAGAFAQFPLRCGWAIQMEWDSSAHAQMLAWGNLHFSRTAQAIVPPIFVTPDTEDVFVTV
jgi:hypothetical protein